jgi:peptide-methionine (S)-S-oxide reductase
VYTFTVEQLALARASKVAYEKALGRTIHTEIKSMDQAGPFYHAHEEYQQYLARPGSRPYCSAQPQSVSLPPYEQWGPEAIKEMPEGLQDLAAYKPKLPEEFWAVNAPTPHCVLRVSNAQLTWPPK